jgi:NTE family protein
MSNDYENKTDRRGKMKIGLALGGGAAYGYAHVGAIKVLEREGIIPCMIAGSSVGSFVAAIYASVMDAKKLEEITLSLDWMDIAMPTIPKEGLVSMERLGDFLKRKIDCRNMEDTKIPYYSVATDIITGNEVVFDKGPIDKAVRASTGLPGIFAPTETEAGLFIDGGVTNNLPADVLKARGADFVIAVDVTTCTHLDIRKHRDIFSIVWKGWQVAVEQNMKHKSMADADMIIKPKLDNMNPFDISKKKEIMAAGESAAQEVMEEIRELISKKGSFAGKVKNFFSKQEEHK